MSATFATGTRILLHALQAGLKIRRPIHDVGVVSCGSLLGSTERRERVRLFKEQTSNCVIIMGENNEGEYPPLRAVSGRPRRKRGALERERQRRGEYGKRALRKRLPIQKTP
jgi:hypothetical protein